MANVFPDMIRRSVPGYTNALAMIGMFTARYMQNGSRCYDLGCSLGAAALSMARAMEGCEGSVVAIDNAPAMVERCRSYVEAAGLSTPVHVEQQDIRNVVVTDASVVVLYYTLQFVPPEERILILRSIYDGLLPGGVLLMSEKNCVFGSERTGTDDEAPSRF